jgi:transcriptional regulator with XRE-family HTH domain
MTARLMFSDMLRAYRTRNGLTIPKAAPLLSISSSMLEKIEGGQRPPQRDFAKRADILFDTPGIFERAYEEVLAAPHEHWFGPRVVFEDKAMIIHEWEARVIVGLCQTREYARAVIRAGWPYDPAEMTERRVEARVERQAILTREDPPTLLVVLGEAALRQIVGGPDVMRAQLDRLLELAEAPGALQVLPFEASDAPGADGPATMFEFRDGSPSVCYLESWRAGRVVEDPQQVAEVNAALTMIKMCALSPSESTRLIEKIRREL